MVTYVMDALGRNLRQVPADLPHKCLRRKHLIEQFGGRGIDRIKLTVRRVIEAADDLVDLADFNCGFRQAIMNGIDRKFSSMLLAAETLLCCGGDYFSVNQESGSGVMALRDAVISRLQSRPMLLLECNRIF